MIDGPNDKYHDLLRKIILHGEDRLPARGQSEGTREIFGREMQMDFDLRDGLPIISTKKVYVHGVITELLWFLRGDTNIKYLIDNKVNIWNKNAYEFFQRKFPYAVDSFDEFIEHVKNGVVRDSNYTNVEDYTYGDLGPIYGRQFERQLSKVIEKINNTPESRDILLNMWNVEEIEQMAIPPCHTVPLHFRVNGEFLDAHMYQRSADMFLGVPFNITSTSLLVILVAEVTGKIPRYFTHTLGAAHIYTSHINNVEKLLKRKAKSLPSQFKCIINKEVNERKLTSLSPEDIKIIDYTSLGAIAADMIV